MAEVMESCIDCHYTPLICRIRQVLETVQGNMLTRTSAGRVDLMTWSSGGLFAN